MHLEPFKHSELLTMGVELELQLIGLSDYDLSEASPDLLALLSRESFPGVVTPEVAESMIEIATGVHERYDPLLAELRQMQGLLLRAGDWLNIGLCGGGAHPFQMWSERRIFRKPRFKEVSALYGYLTKQFIIFGQHVHIGCPSADEALFLLHSLSRYVPHFIALSASSPFVQGADTLFHSARLNSVFAFPLSGRAPFTLSWERFESDFFAKMALTGVVKSMKDFYWDIRPKPEYGTIELRVCDTPLTVEDAAALACYVQAICRMLLHREDPEPAEDDYLVYNYNRFQACRFGIDASIVDPKNYVQQSLRDSIESTLRRLAPHAAALGSEGALERVRRILVLGSGSQHLRTVFAKEGGLQAMVHEALKQFRSPN
jgi:carboxylate-amine ligase